MFGDSSCRRDRISDRDQHRILHAHRHIHLAAHSRAALRRRREDRARYSAIAVARIVLSYPQVQAIDTVHRRRCQDVIALWTVLAGRAARIRRPSAKRASRPLCVSGNYFSALGGSARERSRARQRIDDREEAPPAIVISDRFWTRAFSRVAGHRRTRRRHQRNARDDRRRDPRKLHRTDTSHAGFLDDDSDRPRSVGATPGRIDRRDESDS